MFKLISAIGNNLSESTYIKGREYIKVKDVENLVDTNNHPNGIKKESVIKELDYLQNFVRHNNLKVYVKNIAGLRCKQFFLYTVPALLLSSNILLFCLPTNKVKTENLPAYKKTEIVFVDDKQIVNDSDKTYYGVYFDRNFVDDKSGNCYPDGHSNLDLTLTENLEGYNIDVKIDKDGSITVNEVSSDEFVDLKSYDESQMVDIEPIYVELFDKVVDIVCEQTFLNKKGEEALKSISDSDKNHIVASLVQYDFIGYKDVETYSNLWWARIVMLIVFGLYDWLIIYLKQEQYTFDCRTLVNEYGELGETSRRDEIRLRNLGLKYTSAFLAAEKERIERINKILDEKVSEESKDALLTSYEKKLVLK